MGQARHLLASVGGLGCVWVGVGLGLGLGVGLDLFVAHFGAYLVLLFLLFCLFWDMVVFLSFVFCFLR